MTFVNNLLKRLRFINESVIIMSIIGLVLSGLLLAVNRNSYTWLVPMGVSLVGLIGGFVNKFFPSDKMTKSQGGKEE